MLDAVLAQIGDHDASRIWPDHYTQLYAVTQAVALRRAIEPGKGSYQGQVSIVRLLRQLAEESDLLTWSNLSRHVVDHCPPSILEEERLYIENLG